MKIERYAVGEGAGAGGEGERGRKCGGDRAKSNEELSSSDNLIW